MGTPASRRSASRWRRLGRMAVSLLTRLRERQWLEALRVERATRLVVQVDDATPFLIHVSAPRR